MSAFLVSDETINVFVSYVCQHPPQDLAALRNPLRAGDTLEPSGLGQACWDLNAAALMARYDDNWQDLAGDQPYQWREPPAGTAVMAYRALRCWLYQCSEGDIVEGPLYQAMERYRDWLAHEIVQALPQYEAAPWDSPPVGTQPVNIFEKELNQ